MNRALQRVGMFILVSACDAAQVDFGGDGEVAGEGPAAGSRAQESSSAAAAMGRLAVDVSPADPAEDADAQPRSLDELGDSAWAAAVADALQDLDPEGYPATDPTHHAPWCGQTTTDRQEVCGTAVDEDCDGQVDESPGLGDPCSDACGTLGRFVCDPLAHQLVCISAQGKRCQVSTACGNGSRDDNEACDASAGAPGMTDVEPLETYCRKDCKWDTLFIPACWPQTEQDMQPVMNPITGRIDDACEAAGLRCSRHVRTCVPTLGKAGLRRCPRLRRPESPQELSMRLDAGIAEPPTYRMTEADNGECWITCAADVECPAAMPRCYMGTCVVW